VARDELFAASLDNPEGALRASHRIIEQLCDHLAMSADNRIGRDIPESVANGSPRATRRELFVSEDA